MLPSREKLTKQDQVNIIREEHPCKQKTKTPLFLDTEKRGLKKLYM